MKCYEIIVKGKVQGVFFRDFTKKTADKLGLKGFCKNLDNNDVKIVVCMDDEKFDEFISEIKKGSISATVDNIHIKQIENEDFKNFEVRY